VLIIFVGIVIGFYIVSTILEFISHFSGINLSLFGILGNITNNKNAKLVKDELEKLKSEDDEDCFEVSEAKKEIKIINICSIVCGIIGTVIGISILIESGLIESGGYNGSEAFEILISAIWVGGIGIGGGISYLIIEVPGFFASVYRREGFKEACKIVLGGGALFFILFMLAGPLGWLIRVIKRKNIIKKFK